MAHRLRAGLTCLLLLGGWSIASATYSSEAQRSAGDAGVTGLCGEIGGKLGSVSVGDCLRQDLQATGFHSVLGRPLAIKEYPPMAAKTPLGRILVIGGIHGDEYASVSVVFKWMDILNVHHSGLFHWHFMPLSNPDGLLRENSQRQNERGVDLNRNFPTADWAARAHDYWVSGTGKDPRRFPGPAPASEPEINCLVEEIAAFQPDIIISMHAPFGLIDHDGPPKAPERLGYLTLRRLGVFPGSLGNYGGVDLGIPVVTVELPHAGIMPTTGQITGMWIDLVRWLVRERRAKLAGN